MTDAGTASGDIPVGQLIGLAALALQVIFGLVQLLTFLVVKKVHTQTSMRPPAMGPWPSISFKDGGVDVRDASASTRPETENEDETPKRGRKP